VTPSADMLHCNQNYPLGEGMTASTTAPVRLNFDDYVLYTESHPDDAFELVDGAIYKFAPEGDRHARTRSAIQLFLSDTLDRKRFTPYTEMSFSAPGWVDGPRPDNLVAQGPWMVDGQIAERPTAVDILLVIEVSSTSRPKDEKRSKLYARLGIPEYWLVDLSAATVVSQSRPVNGGYEVSRAWSRGEIAESTAVNGLRVDIGFLLQLAGQ